MKNTHLSRQANKLKYDFDDVIDMLIRELEEERDELERKNEELEEEIENLNNQVFELNEYLDDLQNNNN